MRKPTNKKMMKRIHKNKRYDYDEDDNSYKNDTNTFTKCGMTRKRIFKSEQQATDFLHKKELKMRVYQCEFCQGYHITKKL